MKTQVLYLQLKDHLKASQKHSRICALRFKKIQTVTNKFKPLKWFMHVQLIINQDFSNIFICVSQKWKIPSGNVCNSLSICITSCIQQIVGCIYTFKCAVCTKKKIKRICISLLTHVNVAHSNSSTNLLIICFKYENFNQNFITLNRFNPIQAL